MKILVAMSGGVDSAVAALLLKKTGHTPVGITAKLCAATPEQDLVDAESVARALGIEHHIVDLEKEFHQLVVEPFVECYDRGLTPNPCALCNQKIKFGLLWDYMEQFGCHAFATGHYARIGERNGTKCLLRARDLTRDQSYFLAYLKKEQLEKLHLPLGDYTKDEVRKIALEAKIQVAHKSDSQDICFVPNGDYGKVLEKIGLRHSHVGNFELQDGTKIGKHKGMAYYTIGQRKGLGIAWEHPLYVIAKDLGRNALVLGTNEDLFKKELVAGSLHFINPVPDEFSCYAKIRYRALAASCKVKICSARAKVEFLEPQRAITAGQQIVFYQEDEILGGGVIL